MATAAKVKPYVIPKTLATCADHLYTTRQERLLLQKQVDELQARETALREHLIQNLPKSQATGIAGKVARATVENKDVVQVEDWDKFHTYVLKQAPKNPGIWAMLQKRVGDAAVKEVLNGGGKVPGVQMIQIPVVSLNKV
jgi:hypothetical protein